MSPAIRILAPLVFLIVAARPANAETLWNWPVPAPHDVVRPFDKPPENWLPGHRGVDIAVEPGSTVVAAGAGRVVFAGSVGGKPVVSIEHDNGLRTTYEPVTASVAPGTHVEAGRPIGIVGAGHPDCRASACLHWGLRRGDEYLDPLVLVSRHQVRLKPLHARG